MNQTLLFQTVYLHELNIIHISKHRQASILMPGTRELFLQESFIYIEVPIIILRLPCIENNGSPEKKFYEFMEDTYSSFKQWTSFLCNPLLHLLFCFYTYRYHFVSKWE